MGAIGSLFALITLVLPYLGRHPQKLLHAVRNDAFAQANIMANVHWTGWEVLAAVWMVVILYLGHRFFSKAQYRSGIVTVFGGIPACDEVANGIVQALALLKSKGEDVTKPLVVRLDGNNAELGRKILSDANHPLVQRVDTMDGAADKAAELANA